MIPKAIATALILVPLPLMAGDTRADQQDYYNWCRSQGGTPSGIGLSMRCTPAGNSTPISPPVGDLGNLGFSLGYSLGQWLFSSGDHDAKVRRAQREAVMRELMRQREQAERERKVAEAKRLQAIFERLTQTMKLNGLPEVSLKGIGGDTGLSLKGVEQGPHLELKHDEDSPGAGYGVAGLPGVYTQGSSAGAGYGIKGLPGVYTGGAGTPPSTPDFSRMTPESVAQLVRRMSVQEQGNLITTVEGPKGVDAPKASEPARSSASEAPAGSQDSVMAAQDQGRAPAAVESDHAVQLLQDGKAGQARSQLERVDAASREGMSSNTTPEEAAAKARSGFDEPAGVAAGQVLPRATPAKGREPTPRQEASTPARLPPAAASARPASETLPLQALHAKAVVGPAPANPERQCAEMHTLLLARLGAAVDDEATLAKLRAAAAELDAACAACGEGARRIAETRRALRENVRTSAMLSGTADEQTASYKAERDAWIELVESLGGDVFEKKLEDVDKALQQHSQLANYESRYDEGTTVEEAAALAKRAAALNKLKRFAIGARALHVLYKRFREDKKALAEWRDGKKPFPREVMKSAIEDVLDLKKLIDQVHEFRAFAALNRYFDLAGDALTIGEAAVQTAESVIVYYSVPQGAADPLSGTARLDAARSLQKKMNRDVQALHKDCRQPLARLQAMLAEP